MNHGKKEKNSIRRKKSAGKQALLFLLFLCLFLSGCKNNDLQEVCENPSDDNFPSVYEQDAFSLSDNRSLPGFSHKLAEVYEVDARQGVAWADGKIYVSSSKTLAVYDAERNRIACNDKPFRGISENVNHIGDIDVYNGEIYAGVESFAKGNSKNLLLAVYDAKTLELKEYRPIAKESEQIEISGITVDYDTGNLWICSWEAGNSGRYLYRYDLETREYLGRVQLQASPQEIQGIAYLDGWIYISADDGFADFDEPDHIYRCQVDPEKTAFRVYEEQVLDDVIHYGELEGLTFDKWNRQLVVCYNRGRRINQGVGSGYYDGYVREIHELYRYDYTRLIRPLDYSEECCWAELPWDGRKGPDKKSPGNALSALSGGMRSRRHEADAFLVLPEINLRAVDPDNMDINNLSDAGRFMKELEFERGILCDSADIYAPFYRQADIGCVLDEDGFLAGDFSEKYRNQNFDEVAYTDVRDAFIYYMEHYNEGRPVILFGSSQGAEMVLRLLKEFGDEDTVKKRLVAAYAIGAEFEEESLEKYPYLKPAKEEDDTGVIVSFCPQAEGARRDSEKVLSINPLNWTTDGTVAGASLHQGAVLINTESVYKNTAGIRIGACGERIREREEIKEFIPSFCGAYTEENTGHLIITGLSEKNLVYRLYAEGGGICSPGDYRLYGVRFFYENLKENTDVRVRAFLAKQN